MQKKIYKVIVNALIFIAFSFFMPGLSFSYGPFGHVLMGIGYGIVYSIIPWILHFFRLPKILVLKILAGILLISGYLFLMQSQVLSLLKISKSYIGSTDLIIFTVPKLISLDSPLAVIITSAIILFGCSIIIERLKK